MGYSNIMVCGDKIIIGYSNFQERTPSTPILNSLTPVASSISDTHNCSLEGGSWRGLQVHMHPSRICFPCQFIAIWSSSSSSFMEDLVSLIPRRKDLLWCNYKTPLFFDVVSLSIHFKKKEAKSSKVSPCAAFVAASFSVKMDGDGILLLNNSKSNSLFQRSLE